MSFSYILATCLLSLNDCAMVRVWKKKKWSPFNKAERNEIEILNTKGYSLAAIARTLKRVKSAIWYELTKTRKERPYDATYANHISYVRRKYSRAVGQKIALDKDLKKFVETHLLDDQSPEEISKRLKRMDDVLSRIERRCSKRNVIIAIQKRG